MASRNNNIHVLPVKPLLPAYDRKEMAATAFMGKIPRCPQCGSTTFTLYGCAISGLRKIYENGRPAPTAPADVTLKDYDLYWPDQLECKQCNTITHFK